MASPVTIVDTDDEKHVIWTIARVGKNNYSVWFSVPFEPNLKAQFSSLADVVSLQFNREPPANIVLQLMVIRGNAYTSIPFLQSASNSRIYFSSELKVMKNARLVSGSLAFRLSSTFKQLNPVKAKTYAGQNDALAKLFEEEAFTDFTFEVDGCEIKVSKLLLASRSDVLRAMFEADMAEKKSSRVVVEDISYAGLRSLFKFIYSGKLDEVDLYSDFLVAADKYNVREAKEAFTEKAIKALTEDNIDEIMVLARKHKLEALLEKCFKMIKTLPESKVVIKKLLDRFD